MGGLLIAVIIIILLWNIVIGLSNITSIINYCLDTNTVSDYWKYFFKNCVSGRAIYSSIFMLFTGLIIFIILVPVVIVRSFFIKSKLKKQFLNGQLFDYSNYLFTSNIPKKQDSNLLDFGFENRNIAICGNFLEDSKTVILYFERYCNENNLEFKSYNNFEIYILETDQSATAPLVVYIGDTVYCIYFLYEDFQKTQFQSVKAIISDSKFKNCIYFSTVGEL